MLGWSICLCMELWHRGWERVWEWVFLSEIVREDGVPSLLHLLGDLEFYEYLAVCEQDGYGIQHDGQLDTVQDGADSITLHDIASDLEYSKHHVRGCGLTLSFARLTCV
jgi:hypothetical protein